MMNKEHAAVLASIFEGVKVATVGANDIVVFRTGALLDMNAKAELYVQLEGVFGTSRILILDPCADVATIRVQPAQQPEAPPKLDAIALHNSRVLSRAPG